MRVSRLPAATDAAHECAQVDAAMQRAYAERHALLALPPPRYARCRYFSNAIATCARDDVLCR